MVEQRRKGSSSAMSATTLGTNLMEQEDQETAPSAAAQTSIERLKTVDIRDEQNLLVVNAQHLMYVYRIDNPHFSVFPNSE